jgi:hypothetical protein
MSLCLKFLWFFSFHQRLHTVEVMHHRQKEGILIPIVGRVGGGPHPVTGGIVKASTLLALVLKLSELTVKEQDVT